MVSISQIIVSGAAVLAASVSAAPASVQLHSIRTAEGTPCGTEPAAGIRLPKNGTTITYTAEEQQNGDGATFEIVYCSDDYFKTASLNVTALLGNKFGSGMVLGSALPNPAAAPTGYYGYIFNVTVQPENGDYITGSQQLSIFEVETGYYNANNYNTDTITLNFKKAPPSYASEFDGSMLP